MEKQRRKFFYGEEVYRDRETEKETKFVEKRGRREHAAQEPRVREETKTEGRRSAYREEEGAHRGDPRRRRRDAESIA